MTPLLARSVWPRGYKCKGRGHSDTGPVSDRFLGVVVFLRAIDTRLSCLPKIADPANG
jgi:hypothetical protein